MDLARVQATPPASTWASAVAVTFSAPPTVGHGVVLVVLGRTPSPVAGVTDTAGNAYVVATTQPSPSGGVGLAIWYCAALAATGTPFTVTATGGGPLDRLAVALEVSGVGAGLAVDQATGAEPISVGTVTAGPTPALTAAEAFLVAAVILASQFASALTGAAPWVQEAEGLGVPIGGEVASQILPSAAGTTPSATWTVTGAGATYAAVAIAAFTATGAPPGAAETAHPFVWGPV